LRWRSLDPRSEIRTAVHDFQAAYRHLLDLPSGCLPQLGQEMAFNSGRLRDRRLQIAATGRRLRIDSF
jgi:hypothetical protein